MHRVSYPVPTSFLLQTTFFTHFHRAEMVSSEGKARLHVDGEHFYNPKQLLQRDLSVLALQQHAAQSGSRSLTLLDALCGGGVRAIRYLLEVDHVSAVVANDVDARATRATAVNVELSLGHELRSQFEISQRPAAALMMEWPRRFDHALQP